jgi:hypothetical protein
MDPKEFLSKLKQRPPVSPPTPNQLIDSDDYFIKLNQAWEMEVKYFNIFIDLFMEMERLQGIKCNPRELILTLRLGQS